MAKTNLTAERLRELLDYNPETGVFIRIAKTANSTPVGSEWGYIDSQGYRRGKINYGTYSAHRLAWFYMNGVWPEGEIDHIDGDRLNNRIANLRIVSKSENLQNQRKSQKGSKSGLLGAYFNHGKWRAVIQVNKKIVSLGNFSTAEDAHFAYVQAKRKMHSTCTI